MLSSSFLHSQQGKESRQRGVLKENSVITVRNAPKPELETGNVSSCDIQGAPVVLRVPAVAKDSDSKTRSKKRI